MLILTIKDIINYLSEHLKLSIFIAVAIALIIFYFCGLKARKKERLASIEKEKEERIDAPDSKKHFVQGEEIKRQNLSIDEEEEKHD